MNSERDFILKAAIAAMQGICASAANGQHEIDYCGPVAICAFEYAKSMNTERKKRGLLFDHENPAGELLKRVDEQVSRAKCD